MPSVCTNPERGLSAREPKRGEVRGWGQTETERGLRGTDFSHTMALPTHGTISEALSAHT